MQPKVSIAIANYKQEKFLPELISSIEMQDYKNIEICIYNDTEGVGSGEAFNRAIEMATGDIVVLMCADDVFTCKEVISDIVKKFKNNEYLSHVSRYYYQFIDGDKRPVRAWHCDNIIELANNPSGLAFRKSMIGECKLTNKMFVEAPNFVCCVLNISPCPSIIKYDTVAVRIHNSTARSKNYYLKMWTSSPVAEWSKVGGKSLQNDFTSLIQIKNYFTMDAVYKECFNFIKLRPLNLINPALWFFAGVSIVTPRFILRHIPHLYRITIGRWTTREVKRP